MATKEAQTKKKPKKAAKKSVLKTQWNPDKKLTDKEELFCRYYVLNADTRLNATRAYDLAFDKKLEEKSKDDAIYETDEDGKKFCVQASSYDRCHSVCRTEGNRLLTKPHIDKRKIQLLNELMTDEFVDGELMKVVAQDRDKPSKMRAIAEYNKLGSRVEERKTIRHTFADDDTPEEELDRIIEEQEKHFTKK